VVFVDELRSLLQTGLAGDVWYLAETRLTSYVQYTLGFYHHSVSVGLDPKVTVAVKSSEVPIFSLSVWPLVCLCV